ncbi:SDR family NAD(P)-dependent oxidoreductase [Halorussus salilacus]|uniref:SDR family NAD(P)-dependent oxidoreductase n=1 Tax=Halorussus salilacus TaxID=2953750 RepID=UPI00209FC54A|nr:SDR family NAD(P)-dependent oxidoreductase [Halorussus salilacus]USZ69292.1 SDR family NAD(P)-dependent oxidoreductase [Halorussus salilacus]
MGIETYDSLDGQVALVTGANRGMGRHIAERLADLGATVYAGARRPDDVTSDDCRPLQLDVTDDEDIEAAMARIRDEHGHLDVLINNAAIGGPDEALHEANPDGVNRALTTNLRGPMHVTRCALPLLLEREGARVVGMSSVMGKFSDEMERGGSPAYRVSKTALNGFTAYLDGEYGDEGLIANVADPGWVRTDMGGNDAPRTVEEGIETPVWLARFRPDAPSGQFWRDKEPIEW